jgi:hypothetical protein
MDKTIDSLLTLAEVNPWAQALPYHVPKLGEERYLQEAYRMIQDNEHWLREEVIDRLYERVLYVAHKKEVFERKC